MTCTVGRIGKFAEGWGVPGVVMGVWADLGVTLIGVKEVEWL